MNFFLATLSDVTNQAMAQRIEPTGAVSTGAMILLILAIGLAFAFEFVNGFHDTANAVATVIYTNSLKPWIAVIWSGLWNLIGVLTSPGAVAFGVLALLPTDMVLNAGSSAGFAMVFALLTSAILWNVSTWYVGLPASSSHSLFGAIVGVGVASALMSSGHHWVDGINWAQLNKTLLSLLVSPVIGFCFAGLLLILSKALIRWPQLYQEPAKDKAPPLAVRALLVLTCTGVSFSHGSNDGQKGMGLVLLILIGVLPGVYALNPALKDHGLNQLRDRAALVQTRLVADNPKAVPPEHPFDVLSAYTKNSGSYSNETMPALIAANQHLIDTLSGKSSLVDLSTAQREDVRRDVYEVKSVVTKLDSEKRFSDKALTELLFGKPADSRGKSIYARIKEFVFGAEKDKSPYANQLNSATQFIPPWVKLGTALALGLGTMIGWKRIVVTVGEKIGKTHLTYAQGASAEMVAWATIQLADRFGLPVSTTHVLSSGVAGTMAANRSGLQMSTLRNLLLAWVLTLPVCVLLGAGLFSAAIFIVIHNMLFAAAAALVLLVITWFVWRVTLSKKNITPRGPSLTRKPEVSASV